jgi:hypothetical protein
MTLSLHAQTFSVNLIIKGGNDMKQNISFILIFAALFFIANRPSQAMVMHMSFDEIVQQADVIFFGKAVAQKSRYGPRKKMIFTDVTFKVQKLIHSNTSEILGDEIVLSFAGGKLDKIIRVSDVPSFKTGRRYIIFTRMDGKQYASPIIGSMQGLFRVIRDEASGVSYPLTNGKRPISGIKNKNLIVGAPVSKINNGKAERLSATDESDYYYDVAPEPVGDHGNARAYVSPLKKKAPGKIMKLEEFIGEIKKKKRGEE